MLILLRNRSKMAAGSHINSLSPHNLHLKLKYERLSETALSLRILYYNNNNNNNNNIIIIIIIIIIIMQWLLVVTIGCSYEAL